MVNRGFHTPFTRSVWVYRIPVIGDYRRDTLKVCKTVRGEKIKV